MDKQGITQLLKSMLEEHHGYTGLAKHLGISTAYLNDIVHGRREPGKKILDALKLERITTYEHKNKVEIAKDVYISVSDSKG